MSIIVDLRRRGEFGHQVRHHDRAACPVALPSPSRCIDSLDRTGLLVGLGASLVLWAGIIAGGWSAFSYLAS